MTLFWMILALPVAAAVLIVASLAAVEVGRTLVLLNTAGRIPALIHAN